MILKVGDEIRYGVGNNTYILKPRCKDNYTTDIGDVRCRRVLNEFERQEHRDAGHTLYIWCSGHGPEIIETI